MYENSAGTSVNNQIPGDTPNSGFTSSGGDYTMFRKTTGNLIRKMHIGTRNNYVDPGANKYTAINETTSNSRTKYGPGYFDGTDKNNPPGSANFDGFNSNMAATQGGRWNSNVKRQKQEEILQRRFNIGKFLGLKKKTGSIRTKNSMTMRFTTVRITQ